MLNNVALYSTNTAFVTSHHLEGNVKNYAMLRKHLYPFKCGEHRCARVLVDEGCVEHVGRACG